MADNQTSFGISIDSSGVDKANASLNQFATSARGAATAAREHENASDRMNKQLQEMIRLEQQTNEILKQQAAAQQQAADGAASHRRHLAELVVVTGGLYLAYEGLKHVFTGAWETGVEGGKTLIDVLEHVGRAAADISLGGLSTQQVQQLDRSNALSLQTGAPLSSITQTEAFGNRLGLPAETDIELVKRMNEVMHGTSTETIAARTELARLGITTHDTTQATEQLVIALSKMQDGYQKALFTRSILGQTVDPRLLDPLAAARLQTQNPYEQLQYQNSQYVAQGNADYERRRREIEAEREQSQRYFFGLYQGGTISRALDQSNSIFNIGDPTTPIGNRQARLAQEGQSALSDIFNEGNFSRGFSRLGTNFVNNLQNVGSGLPLVGNFVSPPTLPQYAQGGQQKAPLTLEQEVQAEDFLARLNPATRYGARYRSTERQTQGLVDQGILDPDKAREGLEKFRERLDALENPFKVFTYNLERNNEVAALPEGRERAFGQIELQARRAADPYNPLNPRQLTPEEHGTLQRDFDQQAANTTKDLVEQTQRQVAMEKELVTATGQDAAAVGAVKAGYEAHEIALKHHLDTTEEAAVKTGLLAKSFEELEVRAAAIAKTYRDQAEDAARVSGAANQGSRALREATEDTRIRRQFENLGQPGAPPPPSPTSAPAAGAPLSDTFIDAELARVRQREHGGSYEWDDPRNPTHHGAYQFSDSTWRVSSSQTGVALGDHSPEAQDRNARWLDKTYGPDASISWKASGVDLGRPYRGGPTDSAPNTIDTVANARRAREQTERNVAAAQAADTQQRVSILTTGPLGTARDLREREFREQAQRESNAGQLPPAQIEQRIPQLAAGAAADDLERQGRRNKADEEDLALHAKLADAAKISVAAEKAVSDEIRIRQQLRQAEIDASLSGDQKLIQAEQQRRAETEKIATAERQVAEDKARNVNTRDEKQRVEDLGAELTALKEGNTAYEIEKGALQEINKLRAQGVEITQKDVDLAKQHAQAQKEAEDKIKAITTAENDLKGAVNGVFDAITGGLTSIGHAQGRAQGREALYNTARQISRQGLDLFTKPIKDIFDNAIEGRGFTANIGQSGTTRLGAYGKVLDRLFSGGDTASKDTGGDSSGSGNGSGDSGGTWSSGDGSGDSGGTWSSDDSSTPSYHAGGVVVRRFQDGGPSNLAADEVPAVLLEGERVLNRGETAVYDRHFPTGIMATAQRFHEGGFERGGPTPRAPDLVSGGHSTFHTGGMVVRRFEDGGDSSSGGLNFDSLLSGPSLGLGAAAVGIGAAAGYQLGGTYLYPVNDGHGHTVMVYSNKRRGTNPLAIGIGAGAGLAAAVGLGLFAGGKAGGLSGMFKSLLGGWLGAGDWGGKPGIPSSSHGGPDTWGYSPPAPAAMAPAAAITPEPPPLLAGPHSTKRPYNLSADTMPPTLLSPPPADSYNAAADTAPPTIIPPAPAPPPLGLVDQYVSDMGKEISGSRVGSAVGGYFTDMMGEIQGAPDRWSKALEEYGTAISDSPQNYHRGGLVVRRFLDGGDVSAGDIAAGALDDSNSRSMTAFSDSRSIEGGTRSGVSPGAGTSYQTPADTLLSMVPKLAGGLKDIGGKLFGGEKKGGATDDASTKDWASGSGGDWSSGPDLSANPNAPGMLPAGGGPSDIGTGFSGLDLSGLDLSGSTDLSNLGAGDLGGDFTGNTGADLGSSDPGAGLGGDLSGFGSDIGASVEAFAFGGTVGTGGTHALVDPAVFNYAHYFGNGGLLPDEIPAILHTGERVLNRRETREYSSNSGNGGRGGPGPTIIAPVIVHAQDVSGFRENSNQIASRHQQQIDRGQRNL